MADLPYLASKHGFSLAAVEHLVEALAAGGGSMAQFNHPDLGGPGQWLRGGMLMIGEPFNASLKSRVAVLLEELTSPEPPIADVAAPIPPAPAGGPLDG